MKDITKMSLKINGVGKPLTKYTYGITITKSSNSSLETVFLTVKYPYVNKHGKSIEKIRVYEMEKDIRHPDLNIIVQQLNNFLTTTQTRRITIKVDPIRNYVDFSGGGNYEQYTGWCFG